MDIPSIKKIKIENKNVLLRTDYNVSLNKNHHVANSERIRQSIPTICHLLKDNNRIRIISHLGRPKKVDPLMSLRIILPLFKKLLPHQEIIFADDFFSEKTKEILKNQKDNQIILFENIRFEKKEEENDRQFAQDLSKLADVFVNDAFSNSHRFHASIVGIPKYLPSYIGLQFEKEIEMLKSITTNPNRPFIVIIGGAKTDKINLLLKLADDCDELLIGGKFIEFFNSHPDIKRQIDAKTKLIMPLDYKKDNNNIADIGENTIKLYKEHIMRAKTIFWNGPMGIVEDNSFQNGTKEILDAISINSNAISIVGGGDTITSIAHDKHVKNISHVSTAGGALIEYIETGTLPGIKAIIFGPDNDC